MKAQLRDLLTIDHDFLEEVSERRGPFCIWLRALIGPAGSEGEESFDFAVCSPAWLEAELDRQPLISARVLLVSRTFEPDKIREYVRQRVAEVSAEDWRTIASKLASWSHWEFENYRER